MCIRDRLNSGTIRKVATAGLPNVVIAEYSSVTPCLHKNSTTNPSKIVLIDHGSVALECGVRARATRYGNVQAAEDKRVLVAGRSVLRWVTYEGIAVEM